MIVPAHNFCLHSPSEVFYFVLPILSGIYILYFRRNSITRASVTMVLIRIIAYFIVILFIHTYLSVGYPISWIFHLAVGMAVGYPVGYLFSKFQSIDWLGYALFPLISAWLMPGVDPWMIYLAGILGLIPAFWISVKIKGEFLQKLFKGCTTADVKKTVWKANKTTYLILAVFL